MNEINNNSSHRSQHVTTPTPSAQTTKRTANFPRANKGAAKPILSKISPGVTVVVVRDQYPMHLVRGTIEFKAMIGGRVAGLHMPKAKKVISVLTGNQRSVEAVKMIARRERFPVGAAKREFVRLGTSSNFDVCCEEGMCAILPLIAETGTWITASLSIDDASISPYVVCALERYRSVAKNAQAFVVLFMRCGSKRDMSWLSPHTDEYFEVAECEPGPDTDYAFSIEVAGADEYAIPYLGKIMCSITSSDHGYVRRFERFVAASVSDRIMLWMSLEGESSRTIGATLGISFATVARHIQKLKPTLKSMEPPKPGWRDDYPEYFSANDGDNCELEGDFASDFEGVDE